MRGRQTAAMLRRLGLPELIVSDGDALAREAVAVASDPTRRAELSLRIQAGLPALFDSAGLAEALCGHVEALLAAWA